MNTLKLPFLILAIVAAPLTVGANTNVIGETALGYSSPANLNGTSTSTVIRMSASNGYFTRLSLVMQIVWGTSAILNVKCKVSGDGVNYGWMQRCTSAATHDCGDRVWQWVPADGTTPVLDIETNYPYVQCTFDDPGAGTGTIQVHAIKGR